MHFIQLLTDMSLISFHTVEAFTMDEHKRCLFTQIHKQMLTHTHKQPSIYWKKTQQKAIIVSTCKQKYKNFSPKILWSFHFIIFLVHCYTCIQNPKFQIYVSLPSLQISYFQNFHYSLLSLTCLIFFFRQWNIFAQNFVLCNGCTILKWFVT